MLAAYLLDHPLSKKKSGILLSSSRLQEGPLLLDFFFLEDINSDPHD